MNTPVVTESRWDRPGQQARSRVTQDLLLDAAEELFGAQGIDATSVQQVAKRAERSIGSLYHHFETKDTVVDAVVDRILADLDVEMGMFFAPDRWTDRSIHDVLRGYLKGSLALERGRPGYKRIGIEASITSVETKARYGRNRRRVNQGLRALLLERREAIGHPDPETATAFVVDQLVAMAWARSDGDSHPTEMTENDDEVFIAEALRSALAYLDI